MTIQVACRKPEVVFLWLRTQHSVFMVRTSEITLIEVGKKNIIVETQSGKIDVPREAHGTDNCATISEFMGQEIEPQAIVGEGE